MKKLIAAAALTLLGWPAPAVASETSTMYASNWAYTNSEHPRSSYVGQEVNTPVGRQDDYRARFHFTFDLGTKVYSAATLVFTEKSANDCNAQPPLEVWRTTSLSTAPTWRNPPTELEKLGVPTPVSGYQCPGIRTLNVLDAVKAAQARGDSQLTMELRIAAGYEGGQRFGRKFYHRPALNFTANTVPTISSLQLEEEQTCASTPVWANDKSVVATVSDPDTNDSLSTQFAVWSVAQPSQRYEVGGSFFGGGNIARGVLPMGNFPHGTAVAWSARAYDGHDYSPWAQSCTAIIDAVVPANAPVVSSADYPADGWPGHGGPGLAGTFVLDAQGDTDVVMYEVTASTGAFLQYVAAPAPGAAATLVYTPTRFGPLTLYVTPHDRVHNRGPRAEYSFVVADTAPKVNVEMNGVGLPSTLHMEGATSFTYQINGGAAITVPAAADGTATVEVVFTVKGLTTISVSSTGGTWSGTINVSDAPKVGSSGWDGGSHWATVGQPLTWTFTARSVNVVAYEYQLNYGDIVRIDTPGFDWTPTEAVDQPIIVRSVHADGSTSDWSEETWVWVNAA